MPVVKVFAASREVKRAIGPIGWVVLEDIALDGHVNAEGSLVAETTPRRIAENLGLSKGTVARHLSRLELDGYVRSDRATPGRSACYVIDASACMERITNVGAASRGASASQLVDNLTKLGVASTRARQLVAEHPEQRIREVLDAVGAVDARSPAGWVVSAIRKNWDVAELAVKQRSVRLEETG